LTIAALLSQTISRLLRPVQKPNPRMREPIRRPLPGRLESDPMTMPFINDSRVIASSVV
jgi:hypothetical protein